MLLDHNVTAEIIDSLKDGNVERLQEVSKSIAQNHQLRYGKENVIPLKNECHILHNRTIYGRLLTDPQLKIMFTNLLVSNPGPPSEKQNDDAAADDDGLLSTVLRFFRNLMISSVRHQNLFREHGFLDIVCSILSHPTEFLTSSY